MTDITQPETHRPQDAIAQKVAAAAEDVHKLWARVDAAEKTSETWERRSHQLQAQVEILERELEHTKNKRDFFMRHSTELLSQLSTIQNVIRDAVETAKIAGYRPPLSTSPTSEPATAINFEDSAPSVPPPPSFLTKAMEVGVEDLNKESNK